jgi:hypothetical protein
MVMDRIAMIVPLGYTSTLMLLNRSAEALCAASGSLRATQTHQKFEDAGETKRSVRVTAAYQCRYVAAHCQRELEP